MIEKIALNDLFISIEDYYQPKTIYTFDNYAAQAVKAKGEAPERTHDFDELYYVYKGELNIRMGDKAITLKTGEMYKVPKGTAHSPISTQETWVVYTARLS